MHAFRLHAGGGGSLPEVQPDLPAYASGKCSEILVTLHVVTQSASASLEYRHIPMVAESSPLSLLAVVVWGVPSAQESARVMELKQTRVGVLSLELRLEMCCLVSAGPLLVIERPGEAEISP